MQAMEQDGSPQLLGGYFCLILFSIPYIYSIVKIEAVVFRKQTVNFLCRHCASAGGRTCFKKLQNPVLFGEWWGGGKQNHSYL